MKLANLSIALSATLALLACTAAKADPNEIRVYQSHDDLQITEGDAVINVDPDTAYRTLTDYTRWSSIFPDIHEVVITAQRGDDARVTFIHPDGNRDNVHFHNQPAARMVWFEDTGGRAEVWAETVLIPGDRPGTTRVHSRLFADVHGIASIVVSDMRLKTMREQRVRSDLVNLRAYFARELAASR